MIRLSLFLAIIVSSKEVTSLAKNSTVLQYANEPNCSALITPELLTEISNYKPQVIEIVNAVKNGDFKGRAYKDLEYFVDNFGSRLTGSMALEKSIDFMLDQMRKIGLENVHAENVTAPKWVRGEESLTMLKPYEKKIPILGLALSSQTSEEGIEAQIIVVSGFDDLRRNIKNATGKIIVYNQPFDDPEKAIKYRQLGAIEGAKLGALATLVRSYATFSLGTPHTGLMFYEKNLTQIPCGEISIEDAQLLYRLYKKGENVTLHLKLRNEHKGNIITRNSIGDQIGTSKSDEYVLISGHIDSWDVGQGATDDGYGVIISVKAQEVLKKLNLTTARTIRTVLWTAEEIGEVPLGALQYLENHLEELKSNYTIFLEADSGLIEAHGLIFNGSAAAGCILTEILKLLEPELIKETKLYPNFPRLKTDIVPLMKETGVPGALIASNADKYFWYHHSNADTIESIDPNDMDTVLALWASLSYVLGNLSIMLPK